MELKSFEYIAFMLVVFGLYYLLGRVKNAQKIIVLCASVFFIYMSSGLVSLILIATLTAIVYLLGILIEKRALNKEKKKASRLMLIGALFVVAFLCYFKYFKFTYVMFQGLLVNNNIVISDLITPIGLAYYSLAMVAYLIDISHKKHPAEKNYLDYITYITYFPSIVEGPINLYKKTAYQFKERHYYNSENFAKGFQRIIWGFFKKVVIADRIGILVSSVIDSDYKGVIVIFAMFLYGFQIYADFSGGIDIIMGFSEILDIKLIENFKAPLLSQSVTEYWQRWHMSLGEFMEKYIYYPLILNKRMLKLSRKIKNRYLQKVFSATVASVVVFVLVGMWHGTGWNYVVYGCYQAFWVSMAVLLGKFYKNAKNKFNISDKNKLWYVFTILRTYVIMLFGRYLIRAKDLGQAFDMFARSFQPKLQGVVDMLLGQVGLDVPNMILMILCIILLIVVDVCNNKGIYFRDIISKQNVVVRLFIYNVAIITILIFGIYGPEFSSASFIYGGY